jgi:hypothetical protein
MLNTTPVEHLKNAKTNSILNREDWILLKNIYSTQQTTFRPCDCNEPRNTNKQFSIEASKTFNEKNHPAVGLGELKITFKCSGCRKSFNAVAMLIKYHESQGVATTSTASKRPRVASEFANLSEINPSWNDDIPTDLNTQQNISQTPQPNDIVNIDSKLDKLAMMFMEFQKSSLEKAAASQNTFDRMLSSIDTILSKNIELEDRVKDLSRRLQITEQRLIDIDNEKHNTHMTITNNIPFDVGNPESQQSNDQQPSWAFIARAPPAQRSELSATKAKEAVSKPSRMEAMKALKSLVADNQSRRRDAFSSGKTSAVYFGGFAFQKLGKIWSTLRDAKFQVSRIASIQWIGRTVLEFVLADNYEEQFKSELTALKHLNFRLLDFDPTKNSRAVSEEQSENAMRSFSVRCVKNILMSNNIITIRHFKALAEKACAENPSLKDIFDIEYARCKEVVDKEVSDLVDELTKIGAEENEDYTKSMNRLCMLHPEHVLALEYKRNKNLADSEPSEALAVSSQ